MNRQPFAILIAIPLLLLSCSREDAASTNQESNPVTDQAATDSQIVIHRINAGELDQNGWCLAKPTEGNFSVMLPGRFNDSMLKMDSSKGKGIMHTVDMTTADGLEVNVLQTEVLENRSIEGSPEDLMVERFKKLGATIKRKEINLAGRYPAVRLDVSAQGVTAVMILTSSANNHYMVSVQSRNRRLNREQFDKISARFFQSFRIEGDE